MTPITDETVHIAGAGPAGLAAAITLALAGRAVVVHEAQHEVGHRFQGDTQGLENWTQQVDVLQELSDLGISTDFQHTSCTQGISFDAWGKAYRIQGSQPLLYLLERGPAPGTLDTTLLQQAISLGVEVKFNSRFVHTGSDAILATGPQRGSAIAAGYHFETDMENGFWVICDNRLAPQGYAYLAVLNGHATLKSCMFTDFNNKAEYVQRTVAAFEQLLNLRMHNPVPHGGVVNLLLPSSATQHGHPLAGELAGIQDSRWGFGIRLAITSGVLAARSLLDGSNYGMLWQQRLAATLHTSMVNRAIYARLGNRGYRWYLAHMQRRGDARALLYRQYRPSVLKRVLFSLFIKPSHVPVQ